MYVKLCWLYEFELNMGEEKEKRAGFIQAIENNALKNICLNMKSWFDVYEFVKIVWYDWWAWYVPVLPDAKSVWSRRKIVESSAQFYIDNRVSVE